MPLPKRKRKPTEFYNGVQDYLLWVRDNDELTCSQSDYEDVALALRIIAEARKGTPEPVKVAYQLAFGTYRERFLEARMAREWNFARALVAWEREIEERGKNLKDKAKVLAFRATAS